MSRIALDKEKINPEHLKYLKEKFNEKTVSGAIYKAIKYLATDIKDEEEKIQITLRNYISKINEFEKLKNYLKQKVDAELKIQKIFENER